MSKKTQEDWTRMIEDHKTGKTIAQICNENDVKKSTLRYHLNKTKPLEQIQEEQIQETSEQDPEQDQEQIQEPIQEQAPPKATAKISKRQAPQEHVVDDFLTSFAPENFQSQKKNSPTSEERLIEGMFSMDEIFQPESLAMEQPTYSTRKEKPLAGITKSQWFSGKSKKTVLSDKEFEEDQEQMVLVQKIRLYFVHFPELEKLHIVTRKKGTDVPDTEKWLISLYTKKQADLEKVMNFIKFHVRNNINENSSIKLATNILETTVKVLEHLLMVVGVESKDLTKNVLDDDDIRRCLKEILIDNSINTLNLGAKSDLALKLGMKIVSTDSHNRIDKQIALQAQQAKEKKEAPPKAQAQAQVQAKPLNDDLAKKYNDL